MSMTISNATGDGILEPLMQVSIELPDSGTSVPIGGIVKPVGGPTVLLTGSPVTIPAAPGGGSIYYIIEANLTTGALTVLQSTTGVPLPDPNNVVLFTQTLVPASTDPALDPVTSTPTTY